MKAMAKHRIHSIEFKRQVALDFIAGETLHGLAKRHDISRNLIRIWVKKLEAGAFDEDARAADLLQEYEAKIAALERMVGRQALEIEFLKGALKSVPRPRSASTSVFTGPVSQLTGPVMTDVVAARGRGAFFSAPFINSISSAWRPTIRSRAAIFASYSWMRSAARASSS